MFFVGIDPSLTNTGICILSTEGLPIVVAQSKCLTTSAKKPAERLVLISQFVAAIIPMNGQVFIGYEDYSFGSVHKSFDLAELGGAIKMSLFGKYSAMHLFPPTVIKSFATGFGQAKKDVMLSSAKTECPGLFTMPGVSEDDDDVCDAYFLAIAAMYANKPELAVKANSTLARHRLTVINKKKFKELL